MIYLLAPLAFALGVFGRRVAGGGLNQWAGLKGGDNARVMGDTPARLIYGLTVALSALMGGAVWWAALALIPAVWVGTTTGNFNSIGMGRGSNTFLHDAAGMTLHGALSAVLPCALLFVVGAQWVWFLAACLSAALYYEDAYCVTGKWGNTRLPIGFQYGPDLGEGLWGGACALGAFLAFVA